MGYRQLYLYPARAFELPLASRLSPLASRLSPFVNLTMALSPLASPVLPLASHLLRLTASRFPICLIRDYVSTCLGLRLGWKCGKLPVNELHAQNSRGNAHGHGL